MDLLNIGFLNKLFLDNPVKTWLLAVVIVLSIHLLFRFLIKYIIKHFSSMSKRTKNRLDDLIIECLKKTKFFFLFFVSLFFAKYVLHLPETVNKIFNPFIIIVLLFQAAIWGSTIIKFEIDHFVKRKKDTDPASVTTVSALGFISKLILYTIVFILALDNLGYDITALVTGMGIAGIAVALAVQNILGDLFASLTIVLDKPFVLGDFIIVDEYMGTVENVGLKTTRIRSLFGEQLIFSNNDLLQSRVRNYKRMYERRIVYPLGVIYQTPYEKLKIIPDIIKEIIENQENARFERSHFKNFGDFSLNFETIYWIESPDYNEYMNIQQSINLEVFRRFAEAGIEFAYPSQTVFVERSSDEKAQEFI